MKKKSVIIWSCVALIFLGIGAFVAGFAVETIAATVSLYIVGGGLITAGTLDGLPYVFMEDIQADREIKKHNQEKEPLVEIFKNENKKEEEKVVENIVEKQDSTKDLSDGREL